MTAAEVRGVEESVPSAAITSTEIPSPLSPFPSCERSNVAAVSPKRSAPFLCHW